MKVVISSGHGKYISGAVGPSPWGLHEHTEAVRVVNQTAIELRSLGVEVITYEDTVSHSQDENLNRIVSFHNAQGKHDLDVSVHFNASNPTENPVGCEMYYASQTGMEHADEMVDAVCTASGLKNRGPKDGSGLYFCRNTVAAAVLAEICFVDSHGDVNIYHSKFGDICAALATSIAGDGVVPGPIPPQPPEARRTLKKGDKGDDVVALQKSLGVLIPDGDFGSITDTWVRAFQAACGLSADGIVGNATWAQVDDLDARVDEGEPELPAELIDQIYTMAQESEIADYSWPDRGVPPPGYIAGMALSFAYALRMGGDAGSNIMEQAQGSPDKDALAWYEQEFARLGMSNKTAGIATMRHLFVMMIGLGPRESSGKYCEGRDMSASNVASDTCEAGLFQTSWNIRSGSSTIGSLLPEFWGNPNGFLSQFKEGISPTANNLNSYGSGDGVRYQWLSRFCPLFHVMVTGVGMRVLRAHWGPIGRREVTIKKEADELLQSVQELVLGVA